MLGADKGLRSVVLLTVLGFFRCSTLLKTCLRLTGLWDSGVQGFYANRDPSELQVNFHGPGPTLQDPCAGCQEIRFDEAIDDAVVQNFLVSSEKLIERAEFGLQCADAGRCSV